MKIEKKKQQKNRHTAHQKKREDIQIESNCMIEIHRKI